MHPTHPLDHPLIVSAHAFSIFIHQFVLPCVALQSVYHCVCCVVYCIALGGGCASPLPPLSLPSPTPPPPLLHPMPHPSPTPPPPLLHPMPQTNLRNNNNKFYLIQLLEDNLAKQYSVWMRWGRGQCWGRGGEGEGRRCDRYRFVRT